MTEEKEKVVWTDWKTYERTPCQVFARCMWYIRPVQNFNLGKKSEFYSRKYFEEKKVDNSEFIRKYAAAKNLIIKQKEGWK